MADKIAALVLNYLNGDQSARLILGDILNDESPYNNHPEVQYYVNKLHNTSTVLNYSFWYQFLMKMGQRSTRHKLGKAIRRMVNEGLSGFYYRKHRKKQLSNGKFWITIRRNNFKAVLQECSKSTEIVSADS